MRRFIDESPSGRPRMLAPARVGNTSCISSLSVVVLPAPFGPEEAEHLAGLDVERQRSSAR